MRGHPSRPARSARGRLRMRAVFNRPGPDMALSQRLEIRQSHALVMTPQLMQAIKLLQLSNLDLAAYVEGELERNPLLERAGDAEAERPAAGAPAAAEGAVTDWGDGAPEASRPDEDRSARGLDDI